LGAGGSLTGVDRRGFLRLVGLTAAAATVELSAPTWQWQAFAPEGLVPVGGRVAATLEAGELVGRWTATKDLTIGAVGLWRGGVERGRWSVDPVRLCGHSRDMLRVAVRVR
jgi:hypothetical protein